jgi:hypothetical protein
MVIMERFLRWRWWSVESRILLFALDAEENWKNLQESQ